MKILLAPLLLIASLSWSALTEPIQMPLQLECQTKESINIQSNEITEYEYQYYLLIDFIDDFLKTFDNSEQNYNQLGNVKLKEQKLINSNEFKLDKSGNNIQQIHKIYIFEDVFEGEKLIDEINLVTLELKTYYKDDIYMAQCEEKDLIQYANEEITFWRKATKEGYFIGEEKLKLPEEDVMKRIKPLENFKQQIKLSVDKYFKEEMLRTKEIRRNKPYFYSRPKNAEEYKKNLYKLMELYKNNYISLEEYGEWASLYFQNYREDNSSNETLDYKFSVHKEIMSGLINDPKIKAEAQAITDMFKNKAVRVLDGMNLDNFENFKCTFNEDISKIFFGFFRDETNYSGAAYNYCLKNGITDMNYCEEKPMSKELGYDDTLFLNSSLLTEEFYSRCNVKWGSLNRQKQEEENEKTLYIFEGFGEDDSNQRNRNEEGWCVAGCLYVLGECERPIGPYEAEKRNNQYIQKRQPPKKVCSTNSAGFVECFYER